MKSSKLRSAVSLWHFTSPSPDQRGGHSGRSASRVRWVTLLGACALTCASGDAIREQSSPNNTPAEPSVTAPQQQVGVTCAQPVSLPADQTLASAFEPHFRMGVAVNSATVQSPTGAAAQLVHSQFNQLTAENAMKWIEVQPTLGNYQFDATDRFVAFGEQAGMLIYGHAFVWHQQVPSWVFENSDGSALSAESLLVRLEDHITTLAGRYGDRIAYWDVVNEAFNDDGTLRDTPWRSILGDDYIAQVFALADRVVPNSRLVYNDYSLFFAPKRDAAVRLVQDLQARGIRIDAVGMQGHYNLKRPLAQELDDALSALAATGVEILVTELDLNVLPSDKDVQGADLSDTQAYSDLLNPYPRCLPVDVDAAIAARWRELFDIYVRHADSIGSITFWGVSDGHSWLNNWPISGRRNYPLLFDRDFKPKSSFAQVLESASNE